MSAAVRAMGIEVATVTSPVGRVFSGAGLEQAAARRTRTAVIAPRPDRPTGLLLFFFLLVRVPPETEEVALDVRPFLRLGRAVVAREGDPAGVLDALEDLTNGNAGV